MLIIKIKFLDSINPKYHVEALLLGYLDILKPNNQINTISGFNLNVNFIQSNVFIEVKLYYEEYIAYTWDNFKNPTL